MNLNWFYTGVLSFLSAENTTPNLENSSNIQTCISGFREDGITGQGFKCQSVSLDVRDILCITCI